MTISFAEVVRLVALNWVELTQGPLALTNIPSITIGLPGLGDLTLRTKLQNYYLVLAVAVIAYVLIWRLVHSHFGRAMRGLMENETLAVSVGIDVTKTLTLAAVISAGIAGAAGSLYAHYIRIIDPDVFAFINTVTMVIMVITGGKGSLAGPVVGGMIFGLLPVFLRPIMAPEAQWIAYGGVLIVILFVLPRGIVPSLAQRFANGRAGPKRPRRWLRPSEARRQGACVMAGSRDRIEGRAGRRAFRRPRRDLGHEFRGRRGRDRQPDRAERRRQDHGFQRHDRLSRSDPWRRELSRNARSTA